MANKTERAKESETENTTIDPWEDMVEIRLFKDGGNYSDDVFVAVNGRRFQIKRGVTVSVPRCVAEVLDNSEKQDQIAADLVEQLEREYSQKG